MNDSQKLGESMTQQDHLSESSIMISRDIASKRIGQQRKYPEIYIFRLVHLLLFDILNIVFSSLNRYKVGIGIHSAAIVLHVLIFCFDYYFRTRNYKKQKKLTQLSFDIVYFSSAYLSLICFLLYLCNYFRNPVDKYATTFPA